VVILVSLFLLMRRRRPRAARGPSAAPAPTPLQPWEEGPSTPALTTAPGYVETGGSVAVPGGGSGTAPATAAPSDTEPVPDIDALLLQLDKISVDIMKRPPPKDATSKDDKGAAEEEGKPE